ncbi:MAG: ferritin family protein [Trichlorobacter sp.]|jgi:rubrerythrin|nr:ferritin family protein [Trichlorobacter sp.]
MAINLQEAIKSSIYTEKGAMDFYQQAAKQMTDPEAKRIFELLAREEREHAASFYKMYKGDDLPDFDQLMSESAGKDSTWQDALATLLDKDCNAQHAMELAMKKELQLEAVLKEIAESITDPDVKAVYLQNAHDTHNHYILIESEYAHQMGMVHESDIDTFVRE